MVPFGFRAVLSGADGVDPPAIALMVSDPTLRSSISRSALRKILPLTPAEAEIVAQLAEGRALNEISQAIGTAEGTIRVHLRNIFAKLGLRRQSDLVRVVLESVVRIGRRVDAA